MEPSRHPDKSHDRSASEKSPLSSGQAALRYHFEDLIRERQARLPIDGRLAVRGAAVIARLVGKGGSDPIDSETEILAGGMTEGRPAEAFILSQVRARESRDSDRFVLPLMTPQGAFSGAQLLPWVYGGRSEVFAAPVGLVGHIGAVEGDDVFAAYSPQAQEEALDHVEAIAADVNAYAHSTMTTMEHLTVSSVLLARVLDTIIVSNSAGDPVIYGEVSSLGGPPLLAVKHLEVARGREVAFNVGILAIGVGERVSRRDDPPLFAGSLFLKEYTVSARRGPLAFEHLRVIDLVERAA